MESSPGSSRLSATNLPWQDKTARASNWPACVERRLPARTGLRRHNPVGAGHGHRGGRRTVAGPSRLRRHWLATLPTHIAVAVREPFSARCVVFALLLDRHLDMRETQLRLLSDEEGQPTRLETERLAGHLASTDKSLRLPLIVLVQGTLRQLSPAQYDRFRKSVHQLSKADEQIDLFEFVIRCVLLNHLDRNFGKQQRPQTQYYSVRGAVTEVAVVMSALARVGHRDAPAADRAFQHAIEPLQLNRQHIVLLDAQQCTLARIQAALQKLTTCSLPVRNACWWPRRSASWRMAR